MTVQQILDEARNNLNALSDDLWSDTELLLKLYRVGLKMARKTLCIEDSGTTSTVAGTSEYAKPTNALEIWRLTYAGNKLQYIDYRHYDTINPSNTTSSGTPAYYLYYEDTIILYPTPAAVGTLKYWYYKEPSTPAIGSTWDLPSVFHDVAVDGLTFEMCPKDLGNPLTTFYGQKFMDGMRDMEAFMRRRKRADRMAIVKVEEDTLFSDFGTI